ncbi:MAG TPA: thioredoxin domain-containing protein [Bryobacteraceae bacterium]|nr:thioredoxin domain-containing protein [Bryobacteraceae bacterium]
MRTNLAALALASVAVALGNQPLNTRGSASSPIKMEVFSDYQCPGCKALYESTLRPLIDNYVDKGKVYLVHYEFPLPMHAYAMQAACYALAARRIGKYDQVSDVLFRQQQSWSATGKVGDAACSVLSADEAKKVRALVQDPSIAAEVQTDIQLGRAAHVDGTPTVIVTHGAKQYRVPTGAGYQILSRFLDSLLSN